MLRRICRAKIHRATVTGSHLDYEGSIQVDQALIDAAGILPYEMVLVANLSNGKRFETYVIPGKRNSGVVALNGAAARLGVQGDKVIIMSVGWVDDAAAASLMPKFVLVNEKNKVKAIKAGVDRG